MIMTGSTLDETLQRDCDRAARRHSRNCRFRSLSWTVACLGMVVASMGTWRPISSAD
jgi:hypothetical protein